MGKHVNESMRDAIFYKLMEGNRDIAEEEVAYFRQHPEELDLILDKEVLHKRFLAVVFFIAVLIILGSRVAAVFLGPMVGEFINHVLFDVISEFGIAIMGGVVTAYTLEVLRKNQFRRNVEYRRTMLELLNKNSE